MKTIPFLREKQGRLVIPGTGYHIPGTDPGDRLYDQISLAKEFCVKTIPFLREKQGRLVMQ